jgi:hypothetical protein
VKEMSIGLPGMPGTREMNMVKRVMFGMVT